MKDIWHLKTMKTKEIWPQNGISFKMNKIYDFIAFTWQKAFPKHWFDLGMGLGKGGRKFFRDIWNTCIVTGIYSLFPSSICCKKVEHICFDFEKHRSKTSPQQYLMWWILLHKAISFYLMAWEPYNDILFMSLCPSNNPSNLSRFFNIWPTNWKEQTKTFPPDLPKPLNVWRNMVPVWDI